jgi:carbon-monoxide dehydrogenase large subunit
MSEFGIGQALPRAEDFRLVRGRGRYTDDIELPNQARLVVLRSPHAHARIKRIDTTAARTAPGVIAILTGADAVGDGLGGFISRVRKNRKDGRPNYEPPYGVLAHEKACFVGDPVAAVIAETVAQGKDAAELIEVDYEPLPAITDTAAAGQPGAPTVWADQPDNICFFAELGDKTGAAQGFAGAAHIAKVDLVISRVAAASMEPRMALGRWDETAQRYELYAGLQGPHAIRAELANNVFHIPENQIRVVSPDVGGAFGMKGAAHPELGLVVWAARKVGRPVKWTGERSEAFISDMQARDNVVQAELALDDAGKFLALRIRSTVNLGAYLTASGIHCGVNNLGGLSGVYRIGAVHAEVTGVFTNTVPTGSYRGAGRPEASYMIERVIDVAARDLGLDPAELRRRNLIPPEALPYKTGFIFTYDSGAFPANQEAALKMADWAGFETRRAAVAKNGKLRGIGMAHVIEIAGGINDEMAEIRFDTAGKATLIVGTHNHGQGHETTFRQVMFDRLGLKPDDVRVQFGDTDLLPFGRGTGGSRSASVGATAIRGAADKIIAKGKKIAAHMLEAAETDIEFADGRFAVAGTDRTIDFAAIGRAASTPGKLPKGIEPGFSESIVAVCDGPTFPNGCHVCEIEIDRDTGAVEIVGYWVVEDVGRALNPMIVHGQVHGGVMQGAGQALSEIVVYDSDSGQTITGSFMDYAMPRAEDAPPFVIESGDVPSRNNPYGIKGAGEGGTVGALPAVMNAVCDALAPLGIRQFDMPATPQRLWAAIQGAAKI